MNCTACNRETTDLYHLSKQHLCPQCYEDMQRRQCATAYHDCGEMQTRRMHIKERTGGLRREHRCSRNVKNHDEGPY